MPLQCKLLACAPSSYYYQPRGRDHAEPRDLIEEIASEFPLRLSPHAELGRRGHVVKYRRVLRIMAEENLLVQVNGYMRTTFPGLSGEDRQPAGGWDAIQIS